MKPAKFYIGQHVKKPVVEGLGKPNSYGVIQEVIPPKEVIVNKRKIKTKWSYKVLLNNSQATTTIFQHRLEATD